jgi:hypothetical protein
MSTNKIPKKPGLSKKQKILAVIAICIAASLIASAFALEVLTWTQTLTVPGGSFTVQTGSGPITASEDLSSGWTWGGASFTMSIQVTNTGSSTFLPIVTQTGLPAGWTFATSTITAITASNDEIITLTVTPPNVNSGTTSGPFAISVSA